MSDPARGNRVSDGCSAVVNAVAVALIWRTAQRAEIGDCVCGSDCFAAQARNETHDADRQNAEGHQLPRFETAFER